MTIDERISSELRRHAPQVDEQAAWERFQSAAPERHRVMALRLVPVAAAVLGFVLLGLAMVLIFPWDPAPVAALQSPFRGVWVTTDSDGSTVTMTVEVSSDGVIEITALDDYASVCSGAASSMTGSGRLESETELVIPTPVLTCDDGTEPQALSGPPLEEQLLDLTFVIDTESGTLTDSFGSVWTRQGAEDPIPEPTPTGPEPTELLGVARMWPQSSLEEVQEAQELADAGDPEYTWQVDPDLLENLDSEEYLGTPEIFSRYLEELGWEDSVRIPGIAGEVTGGDINGTAIEVTFIRCAPGKPNAIWPDHPRYGGCAPTIDEFHYETLSVFASRPARLDPSGIWVVNWSAENPPTEQVAPLTETEAAAILEAFLQARIDGEGAEQYLADAQDAELLYSTSTGSPYERYEYQLVAGPEWPNGYMDFEVQMFAEGGQILEQAVDLSPNEAGDWVLGPHFHVGPDNGQPLPTDFGIFDGEVTFQAESPWVNEGPRPNPSDESETFSLSSPDERMIVLADPLPIAPGCDVGSAPADAAALAQSIISSGRFEATAPVEVTIGGAPALQMDMVADEASLCWPTDPDAAAVLMFHGLAPGHIRLYLADLPGDPARILSIAIVAPESRFDAVVEEATPVLDTFEFHTG